jgi:uncharacterized UBP type Zn finger protein
MKANDQIDLSNPCAHVTTDMPRAAHRPTAGCKECLEMGSRWVHLRICLTCSHVGCCDDSPNRHATKHARTIGHPIIRSLEPGEAWSWCYVDEVALLLPEVRGSTRIPPSPLLA